MQTSAGDSASLRWREWGGWGGEERAPKAMEGEALAPGVSQEKEMDAPTTSASKDSWIQLGFSSLKSFCA